MTSDFAALSAEAIIEQCSEFVVPRADWGSAAGYPSPLSTDGTLWAWEFLRRSTTYAEDFNEFSTPALDLQTGYDAEATAVAWNISALVDPENSYEMLRTRSFPQPTAVESLKVPSNTDTVFRVSQPGSDTPLWFAGTTPHIELPCFALHEGRARGPMFFDNGRLRAATEHPIYLATNQVAVRLTLDADLDVQLNAVRTLLRDPRRTDFTSQYKRFLIVDGPDLADGSEPAAPVAYPYELDRMNIHIEHLWLALRTLDALELYKSGKVQPSEYLDYLRDRFNSESAAWTHIDPRSAKFGALHTRADMERHLRYGLRYALNGGYVRVANTDLAKQLSR